MDTDSVFHGLFFFMDGMLLFPQKYELLITIEHMLLFCYDLIDIREQHFTASTLRTLFRDVPLDCLLGNLRETNIFARLYFWGTFVT